MADASQAAQADVWTYVLFQLGGGGILGFAAGYAVKKLLKLIMIIVGLFVAGLLYMSYKGWLSVNYEAIARSIESALTGASSTASGIKGYVLANIPFASAFLLGFALGFKVG